jgi:septal ring factor EnvC (AmiA/AmiB activator)
MLYGMKKIETVNELLAWAQRINNRSYTIKEKCDLQDIYARSQRTVLDKLFIEAESERKLVICSVNNVMAFDEVEHLLDVLAKHKARKQWEIDNAEIEKRYSELSHKEYTFEQAVKSNEKTFANLTDQLRHKDSTIEMLQNACSEHRNTIHDLRLEMEENKVKAENYDEIKRRLA